MIAGELLGDFGLADAGGAGEQIGADGLFRLAQAGARQLDGRCQRMDRLVLAIDHAAQIGFQRLERFGIVLGDRFGRDARHLGDHLFHFLDADHLLAAAFGQQHLRGAHFVDHVDRLVGQLAVVDVFGRQLHRRLDRVGGVADLVVILEIGLDAHQDLDRIRDRGLGHVDLLEAAHQGAVLLEILAVFLVGGRADAAQDARRQRRLEQVGGIHRPAAGGAGADHGVNLVDEQDGALDAFQLLDHGLEPLLEIAAIAGARDQRAHVEGIDGAAAQHFGHFAVDDLARQAFGDGGLAHAGIAHEQADCSSGGGRGSGWCARLRRRGRSGDRPCPTWPSH